MPEPRVDLSGASASIVDYPKAKENFNPGGNMFSFRVSSFANTITPWGSDWRGRDRQLRDFWITEPFLAGGIYAIAAGNANYRWELDGPARTVEQVRILLNTANRGKGWINFAQAITIDILTQDNGAFIEVIRDGPLETSPVVGIAHLDASRCVRTGDPSEPVIYYDRKDKAHLMKWYQVIPIVECPAPVENMYGMQYSGLTRVLKISQMMNDISTYKSEKVGGRFEKAIHIVGGPSQEQIKRLMTRSAEEADNSGLTRFMMPTILASLDPEKPVSHVEIPLASMPDNFNYDQEMKWYLACLALGFGRDYQDFAPLPTGNVGTSTQSEILDQKAKAKGPALFMRLMEYVLNFYGIMPQTVHFAFEQIDLNEKKMSADTKKVRAETRAIQIASGEINPAVAQQMASDDGDLDETYLAMMGAQDLSPRVTVSGEEPVDTGADVQQVTEINTPPPAPTSSQQPTDSAPVSPKNISPKYFGRLFAAGTLQSLVQRIINGSNSEST
jgi:hypothetical protein